MLCARVSGDANQPGRTLSVCCLTRGPTARVAAQLSLLRDAADEIVVGLDTSVEADLAHPLEDVADVLVHYPYADPVDRPVGWVHSLCTRDWILWVDDDEIPSARLVGEVRDVIADPSITHCFVPRRTLWRDPENVLTGPPWVPDFQLRLVQNDPRVVWFPGITHWPIQAIGPHRYLDTPLYHTDLLLNPVERRRAKVRRYEAAIPGRRVAGLPMNDAYFLPEDREGVRLEPVDAADRDTVVRILELDPWPEPRPSARPIRTATRDEVDAHWRGAPATEGLYRGTLELVDEVAPFALGERRGVVRPRCESEHSCLAPRRRRLALRADRLPVARRAGSRGRPRRSADTAPFGARTRRHARRPRRRPGSAGRREAHARPRPAARARSLVRLRAPGGGRRAARALRRDPRGRRGYGPRRRGNARGGGALRSPARPRRVAGADDGAPRLRRRGRRPRVRPRDGRGPRQDRRDGRGADARGGAPRRRRAPAFRPQATARLARGDVVPRRPHRRRRAARRRGRHPARRGG